MSAKTAAWRRTIPITRFGAKKRGKKTPGERKRNEELIARALENAEREQKARRNETLSRKRRRFGSGMEKYRLARISGFSAGKRENQEQRRGKKSIGEIKNRIRRPSYPEKFAGGKMKRFLCGATACILLAGLCSCSWESKLKNISNDVNNYAMYPFSLKTGRKANVRREGHI